MGRIVNHIINFISKILNKLFEFNCRRRLKNNNFSIICSTCIGGVIYHRLGLQFLSPTINLWLNQKDFIKFISNLEFYINKELVFFKHEVYNYPVATLANDVTIYFNHAKNEEEARELWNKRRSRINFNNLYIILYERDGITTDDLHSLNTIKCKNLIVLSDKNHPDIPYVKTIKPATESHPNYCTFLDKDIFGFRTFEKQFDFVQWLNND